MNIHLPTRPNIQLALAEYRLTLALFAAASFVCVVILGYLVRRIVSAIRKMRHTQHSHQQLLRDLQKKYRDDLYQLEGRAFVVGVLTYLERYSSQSNYAGLEDILAHIGIEKENREQILLLYYSQRGDERVIASYLKQAVEII